MRTIEPYKGITLEFEETRHRFTRIIGGIRTPVPGVTSITGLIDKSRILMGWQERITREDLIAELDKNLPITVEVIKRATSLHRTRKEAAATAGTMVHEFAEHFSLGLKPEMPENEQARNGCLAFLKWVESEKIKLSNPEQLVYSKKNDYAGIADSDGKRGQKLFLLDYKTSKGIYPEMRIQTSAYREALEEMKKIKYEGIWILRFDKESGDFEPVYIERKESKKDFEAFLGLLPAKRRLKELDKYGRE